MLFEFDNIAPPSSGVLALEIVLDGIGKYICLTVLLSVLLCAYYDCLRAVTSVNPINHSIQPLHLLNLLRINIEQVLLNWEIQP